MNKNYMFAVILTAIVAAIAELMTPQGEGGGLSGHIRLIASLCILVALIKPISNGMALLKEYAQNGSFNYSISEDPSNIDREEGYENVFFDEVLTISESEFISAVKAELLTKFSIPPEECRIIPSVSYVKPSINIEHLTVVLKNTSIFKDPHEISEYISSLFGCECTVAIE